MTNRLMAGVGKPIKESVCLSSILNFANLKQAAKVTSSHISGSPIETSNSVFISYGIC